MQRAYQIIRFIANATQHRDAVLGAVLHSSQMTSSSTKVTYIDPVKNLNLNSILYDIYLDLMIFSLSMSRNIP